MSEWVTHSELDAAIAAVRVDIDETERRLRDEFTNAVQYEGNRTDTHLAAQDESIKWIVRFSLSTLVGIIVALIYLLH